MKWNPTIILFAFCFFAININSFAQDDDVQKLQENARVFLRQGDYANASLILVRAWKQAPNNLEIAKDLSFVYYLQKDNEKGIQVILPFLDKPEVDDQSFQIAGNLYRASEKFKDAEKVYKKGIKLFPKSGPLYNDFGEMIWPGDNAAGIKLWEKGIEEDPSFAGNYYNSSKHYFLQRNLVWTLLYGEIFINLESYTPRTTEIKNILLNEYKRLFAEVDLLKENHTKNKFELAFLSSMNGYNSIVQNGITPETLTMIRTRFILDWELKNWDKFPFKLFELHRQLLEKGLFPMYNHWVFGAAQNLTSYDLYTKSHKVEYDAFTQFQKENVLKIPYGQYYH
jgi:tetratricopeptide (TPR) repeat protein